MDEKKIWINDNLGKIESATNLKSEIRRIYQGFTIIVGKGHGGGYENHLREGSSATKSDDLVNEVHSKGAAFHSEVEEIAANATDQLAAFHSEVVEIVKIINPAAKQLIKSIEDAGKEEMRATSPELQEGKGDGGLKVGSSTKHKVFWQNFRKPEEEKEKKAMSLIAAQIEANLSLEEEPWDLLEDDQPQEDQSNQGLNITNPKSIYIC
ncbi:hypothetical protein LOK49_LG07G01273 [Camellia lanceoleosa]|uniref:Uncharacterized protein n=1 Tax=Camellia lanceoleosa TaxID=1840588 RepID=A0ACC0H1X9_9ERIC|nr:hypothetical protein LOK49_LG07G01273 [Camellia lanceoleosa]